jgi:hypothetical protein
VLSHFVAYVLHVASNKKVIDRRVHGVNNRQTLGLARIDRAYSLLESAAMHAAGCRNILVTYLYQVW